MEEKKRWPEVWVWRDQITGKLHTTTGGTELAVHPPTEGMRDACIIYVPVTERDRPDLHAAFVGRLEEHRDLLRTERDQAVTERDRYREVLEGLRRTVDDQAEDEGLWANTINVQVAYAQQELRKLHAQIETVPCPDCSEGEK